MTCTAGARTFERDRWRLNLLSVRYAAPPVGKLRWQAPVSPPQNNSQVTLATEQPPLCPQTGAYGVPEVYGFNSAPGDEDCLFLNVYAAPNASNLPVLLWIRESSFPFGYHSVPSVRQVLTVDCTRRWRWLLRLWCYI